MLELDKLRAGYGDAVVLEDISLKLDEGGSLAVLGRNGVGKSTLLLTLMGFTRVHSGAVRFRVKDITHMPPHRRAQAGIGWV
ncbi:MAG TPA: ATP-binding cassette domain-containing protein, partial [Burkholderiales bacterium]|nr:ATP-binding cassette domain-containing protein [Burkholderiales bacterium]